MTLNVYFSLLPTPPVLPSPHLTHPSLYPLEALNPTSFHTPRNTNFATFTPKIRIIHSLLLSFSSPLHPIYPNILAILPLLYTILSHKQTIEYQPNNTKITATTTKYHQNIWSIQKNVVTLHSLLKRNNASSKATTG